MTDVPVRRTVRPGVDPVRLAALEVLKSGRVDDAYTNLVLPSVLRQNAFTRAKAEDLIAFVGLTGIADRAYVLETGRSVLSGPSATLAGDARVREAYLGEPAA